MRIALLSDIHDHLANLDLALRRAGECGCEHLIFMGDMASTATFRHLIARWGKGIDLVLGNNEWERELFALTAWEHPGVTLHGEAGEVELDGRRLFFAHLPYRAEQALQHGDFDAIFYGHTHRVDLRPAGPHSPLIVNPGDLQGRYTGPAMAVYDTETNTAHIEYLTRC